MGAKMIKQLIHRIKKGGANEVRDLQDIRFDCAMGLVGLSPVGVDGYQDSAPGFSDYLGDALNGRSSNFSPKELLGSYGKRPPKKYWPRLALLRWWADQLRDDEPVSIAHAWRPEPYNSQVGGAKSSAHVDCCALDLDFRSRKAHRFALDKCRRLHNSDISLGIGVGIGNRRIHFDLLSTTYFLKGRPRYWLYDSWDAREDAGEWMDWR